MADRGKAESNLRDLQLLCIGYGLNKGSREQLLGSLPQGICSLEIEELLSSFREGNPGKLISWLSDRGVVVEKGRELIMTITSRINQQHKRKLLEKAISVARYAAMSGDVDEVMKDLRTAIDSIEKE